MADELKEICNKIKQLVPPAIPEDMTGPFEEFMNDISSRIEPEDREAIHRAYNYFNRMLGAQLKGSVPLDSRAQAKTPGQEDLLAKKSGQEEQGSKKSGQEEQGSKTPSEEEQGSKTPGQEDLLAKKSGAKSQQVEDPLQHDNTKQEPPESDKDEEMVSILVKAADSTFN